jgi:hypothetical protein
MSGKKPTLGEKLLKLHALIGSPFPAERDAAIAKINELLARHGRTWNDLQDLLQTSANPDPAWNVPGDGPTVDDALRAGLPGEALTPPNALACAVHVVEKYLDLKKHESIAVALWALHTHVFQNFSVSPRLAITSPVNGCGKTTALVVLEQLASQPQRMDNATPAVLYHLIDRLGGTMLVDEADNLGLQENGILRAVLNSGHRVGGNIRRLYQGSPRQFSTFGPMAIGAIGVLPMPLMRRSIIIHMERTARGGLTRFDSKDPDVIATTGYVRGVVLDWANGNPVLDVNPDLPKALRNRVADNWRPLIAIADSFGEDWGQEAREAAIAFATAYHDEDAAVVLLEDIRTIFDKTGADRMASESLVKFLLEIEESGWSEYRGPCDDRQARKLTQSELARLLRPFGIRPRTFWPHGPRKGGSSRKGYLRAEFEKAWASYCASTVTPSQGRSSVVFLDF